MSETTQMYEFPIYFPTAVKNAYDVHKSVCEVMLRAGVDEPRDFIFDIECLSNPDGSSFALVRSSRLPKGAVGAPTTSPTAGVYEFSLRAAVRKFAGKTAPKRADHLSWLSLQGERNGFRVIGTPTTFTKPRAFYKPSSGASFTVIETKFDGSLEVTDPVAFSHAWSKGLGASRAFGYGLIHCTPIQ